MKRIGSISLIILIAFSISFTACSGGPSDDPTTETEEIYDASGEWYLESALVGNQCSQFSMSPAGSITITMNEDNTFVMSLNDFGIIIKGTKQDNNFEITSVMVGSIEMTDMLTGSFTLTSDTDLNGKVTIKYDETCQEVFEIKGSR